MLLARAKRALGARTTRQTVEEALRRAAGAAGDEHTARAAGQMLYLERLPDRADVGLLASEVTWR